ncbi:MAG: beta-galactosidase, partial [Bacteroidaceae bacterium]|nr:beta-galactosidase [Bacteroidaceae bacterium]
MKRIVYFISLFFFIVHTACSQTIVPKIEWDSRSLIIDGHRVVLVMGELHYSRVPADEWATEIRKMRDGGVTMIACYVFWNHIEEVEGQYDWSGQRNLRRFLELCKEAD